MAKESNNMSVMSGLAEASNQLRGRPGLEAVGHIEGNSLLEHQSQGNDPEIEKVRDVQSLGKRDTISATDKSNEWLPRSNPKDKGSKRISGDLQNGLLIVAILIATVTYQAGMAPPPSIWKEDMSLDLKCISRIWPSLKDSTRSCPAYTFYLFMGFNTAGFSSAIHLISVAFVGRKKDLAVLLLIVSLTCMLCTYATLLMSISQNFLSFLAILMTAAAISTVLQIWCRFPVKLYTKFLRPYFRAQGVTAGRDCTLLEPAPNHVSSEDV